MNTLDVAGHLQEHQDFATWIWWSILLFMALALVLCRRLWSTVAPLPEWVKSMVVGVVAVTIFGVIGIANWCLGQSHDRLVATAAPSIAAEASERYAMEVPEKIVATALQHNKIGQWRAVFPDGTGWEMIMFIDKDSQTMRVTHGADIVPPDGDALPWADTEVKAAVSIVEKELISKGKGEMYAEEIADLQIK